MVKASGNPKTPQFATGALGAPKSNSANKSVTYGWSGRGDLNARPPCAQGIGCPHLGINRFNNLRTLLVGPCGNFSYNLDCKAAIRLVKPPTTPTGSPAGSADCEINQRGRAYVVTAGSLEGPPIAGFKLGDPLLLRQVVVG